ncbi:MAG TPA: helix-turn-helix transcriptional regulator [Thermoanaerobaculia bacterium]|nr:helix-turn-helix transcriptional regulator [Thermoanaerobaculia bacterium]
MRRINRLVRLFRALSGETQIAFGETTGVSPGLLAKYELGAVEPNPDHLERLARGADLTVAAGEQILDYADALRQPRLRAGSGMDGLPEQIAAVIDSVYQRLLRLPPR